MRQLFLTFLSGLALFALACEKPLFDTGVGAFDVAPDGAILWTHVVPAANDAQLPLVLEVSTSPDFASIVQSLPALATAASGYTARVTVGGLAPATQYYYRFHVDAAALPLRYSLAGHFRTAPDPSSHAPMRFVFSGDANLRFSADTGVGFQVLAKALKQDPDFFVFFGDTIYADTGVLETGAAVTLDEYRTVHRYTRQTPELQQLIASTGTFGGWDDHEVVNDYDSETVDPARFAAGAQAFLEWFPVRQQPGDPPLRTYRRVRWGADVELFFLDGRQFRSAELFCNPTQPDGPETDETLYSPFTQDEEIASGLLPDDFLAALNPVITPSDPDCVRDVLANPQRTVLGAEQLAWLEQSMLESTATFKIVINNTPISSLLLLPYDRWESYVAERQHVLDFLAANFDPDHVVFLTTDFHMNLGLKRSELTELVVGPIGTNTFGSGLLARLPASLASSRNLVFLLLDAVLAQANDAAFLGSAYDALAYALVETFYDDAGEPHLRVSVQGNRRYAFGTHKVRELFRFELPQPPAAP